MLGGHFDSWTGGTGATDNAAGAAVAMEAMRILKTLDLENAAHRARRLCGPAKKKGMLGSRAYVKEHFADPDGNEAQARARQTSAYYNLDNGSGKIRGIYMQDNDAGAADFSSLARSRSGTWAPLPSPSATPAAPTTWRSTPWALPGFQFIQDPLEYGTRTHHSNMDVYDRLQPNDLEQASAIMAWFVYNTATRPDMMPRKPMPKPGRGPGRPIDPRRIRVPRQPVVFWRVSADH